MKRLVVTILLICVYHTQVISQCYRIDSLRRVVTILPRNDTNRLFSMNLLAREYYEAKQYKNAEYFAKQAFIASQNLQYKRGMADAYLTLAGVYFQNPLTRDEESINSYNQALEIYKELQLDTQAAETLKRIGDYYYDLFYLHEHYYEKSLEYYLAYLALVKKMGDKVQTAEAYVTIGNLYNHLGDQSSSREYLLMAFDIRREIEDEEVDNPHLFSEAQKFYELRIENQKLYNYILIGGMVLLLLGIAALAFFMVQKSKSNRLLSAKNKEIEQQKDDIEEINKELRQKTEEIVAQRDQLAHQNIKIREAQEEIETANSNLRRINQHLEDLVAERTQSLQDTNEALSMANQELDTLIYRASHDFKGPVATLTGLSQIARLDAQDKNTIKYFDKVEQTAQQMDGMLEKLHQVSYIIGKKLDTELLSFEDIIQQVKANNASLLQDCQASLEITEDDLMFIHSDMDMMLAIFDNLVENSIHFRNQEIENPPQIQIRISNSLGHIIVDYQDNGAGIPAEQFPKIFDMFFRGSEESKGNGLGLYVVKKALERLKAEIKVDSREGTFTHFSMRFPK